MDFPLHYQNDPHFVERRRSLRSDPTKAEYVLWQELRAKKLGVVFRRQFSIGQFIVDFYCHTFRLIIELDGPIHEQQKEYDRERQIWLEKEGYSVLRFKNDDVLFEREKVLVKIQSLIKPSLVASL